MSKKSFKLFYAELLVEGRVQDEQFNSITKHLDIIVQTDSDPANKKEWAATKVKLKQSLKTAEKFFQVRESVPNKLWMSWVVDFFQFDTQGNPSPYGIIHATETSMHFLNEALTDGNVTKLNSLSLPEVRNNRFTFAATVTSFKNWQNTMLEQYQEKLMEGLIPFETYDERGEHPNLLLKFPNGYAWYDLLRPKCTLEKNALEHCGNTASWTENDTVLSLREVKEIDGKKYYKPYLTAIYDKETKMLGQTKGRKNSKPAEKYYPYLMSLLMIPGYIHGIEVKGENQQIRSDNFRFNELSEEQQEQVVEANPSFNPKESKSRFTWAEYRKIGQRYDVNEISHEIADMMIEQETEDWSSQFETFGIDWKFGHPEKITKVMGGTTYTPLIKAIFKHSRLTELLVDDKYFDLDSIVSILPKYNHGYGVSVDMYQEPFLSAFFKPAIDLLNRMIDLVPKGKVIPSYAVIDMLVNDTTPKTSGLKALVRQFNALDAVTVAQKSQEYVENRLNDYCYDISNQDQFCADREMYFDPEGNLSIGEDND